jgi:hypothetical protein
VTGNPVVFWILDDALLPKEARIVQKTSDKNDVCHHNLDNVSNGQLGKLVSRADPKTMYVCNNGQHRLITDQDIEKFIEIATATKVPTAAPSEAGNTSGGSISVS